MGACFVERSDERIATLVNVPLTYRSCRDNIDLMNVFLSYAAEDRDWVRELASHLKQSGIDLWDPATQVLPGDNWALKIGQALEASDAMIVLLSPAASKYEEIRQTVQYALGSERFKDRLIPVMVRSTTRFPWILKDLEMEQGSPSDVSKRIVKRLKKARSAA